MFQQALLCCYWSPQACLPAWRLRHGCHVASQMCEENEDE